MCKLDKMPKYTCALGENVQNKKAYKFQFRKKCPSLDNFGMKQGQEENANRLSRYLFKIF